MDTPVYQGKDSCMFKREGIYVRRIQGPGVDTIREALALAYMILRDYRRGYTYDNDSCRKIKMTGELFKKRIKYIYTLSIKHGATAKEQEVIKRIVNYVLKHRRMPKEVTLPDGRKLNVKSVIKRMVVKT